MKWQSQAEAVLSRVPFFVRKRVRRKVEAEAVRRGAEEVCLEDVRACQRSFLETMEAEVKGYEVETCFGAGGCSNRAVSWDDMAQELERRLSRRNLRDFLKQRVRGPLKMHHEFRVSVSDCPNACSRPQIVDIGLIGARRPRRAADKECSRCGACVDVCQEEAIFVAEHGDAPMIDYDRCLTCGKCLFVCPTGTLQADAMGYRIMVGGKLGRHPRLGWELPGIYGAEETLRIVGQYLDHYQTYCSKGERLGDILERIGFDARLGDTKSGGGG